MTHFQIVLLLIYALVLAVWIGRHLLVNRIRRDTPFLTPNDSGYRGDDRPVVSVLIPAKDEEESIGECLLSVLNQSYEQLEVIVIDDRSEDGTSNVVREIAARDPRVRLVSTTGLPAGWTGKTHALATGVREARGDWLLFIDSDTRHHPDSLSIMLEYARRERADLVSVLPRMRNGSFWERVVHPLAGMILMLNFPFDRINDDSDSDVAFANGQCILIGRNVYDAVGGHSAVCDKFVEDIHLAGLLKARGYRVRVAMAPQLSSTRMYTSLGQLVQGWSRILYAAYNHSIIHLATVLTGLVLFSLSAYAVLAASVIGWATGHASSHLAVLFGMTLVNLFLQGTVMLRAYSLAGNKRRYVAFYALAAAVMFYVLAAALKKCITHRIVWRGTRYERLEEAVPIILPLPTAELSTGSEQPLKQSA